MHQRVAESKESDQRRARTRQDTITNTTPQVAGSDAGGGISQRQQAVLRMQQTHGNAAVRRMLSQHEASSPKNLANNLRSRVEEDENGNIISDRQRPVQRDDTTDGGATALSGGSGAPATATTPITFPSITEIRADANVERERAADWAAGQSDYKERFGWVMWDSSSHAFSVTGKTTGDEDGVGPSSTPSDSGTLYRVGEYHQHPPLRPGRDGSRFPVGPSQADTDGANAANGPGVVRDFTTRARTTVTDYNYGPTRRR